MALFSRLAFPGHQARQSNTQQRESPARHPGPLLIVLTDVHDGLPKRLPRRQPGRRTAALTEKRTSTSALELESDDPLVTPQAQPLAGSTGLFFKDLSNWEVSLFQTHAFGQSSECRDSCSLVPACHWSGSGGQGCSGAQCSLRKGPKRHANDMSSRLEECLYLFYIYL